MSHLCDMMQFVIFKLRYVNVYLIILPRLSDKKRSRKIRHYLAYCKQEKQNSFLVQKSKSRKDHIQEGNNQTIKILI